MFLIDKTREDIRFCGFPPWFLYVLFPFDVLWLISVSEFLKPLQSVLPPCCLRILRFLRTDILISTLKEGIKKPGAGAAGQILSYNLETEE
ncbi:MAG TPA: hypothetical protein DC053_18310 [Lachnoclostridium sp.]|nr:hypothetical protein [Lachnoclostridium sp.]